MRSFFHDFHSTVFALKSHLHVASLEAGSSGAAPLRQAESALDRLSADAEEFRLGLEPLYELDHDETQVVLTAPQIGPFIRELAQRNLAGTKIRLRVTVG